MNKIHEETQEYEKVLFSGRFDPPHPGHIITIMRLLADFKEVSVVILKNEERRFPVTYVVQVFGEIFRDQPVNILHNETHFGTISKEQLQKFDCDIYAAGNLDVLKHIENMGFPCVYVERSYEYSASNYQMDCFFGF